MEKPKELELWEQVQNLGIRHASPNSQTQTWACGAGYNPDTSQNLDYTWWEVTCLVCLEAVERSTEPDMYGMIWVTEYITALKVKLGQA